MSTVMDKEQIAALTNDEILQRWYTYLTGPGQGSDKTYETYKTQIKKLANWCQRLRPGENLLTLNRQDIRDYFAYMIEVAQARRSLRLNINTVRSFYSWAVDEEEVIDKFPVPRKLKVKGRDAPKWTPNVKQVLRMRALSVSNVPTLVGGKRTDYLGALARIALIELLTSTGLRIGEVEQVRVDSIDWSAMVYDEEEGNKSPFVGGSIHIDTYHIGSKQYKEKTVWISVLAAKLIRLYIKKMMIAGNAPLFPWCRRTLQGWVEQAGKGVINEEAQPRRTKGYTDMTPEQLAKMPLAHRKRVMRKMQHAERRDEHAKRADQQYTQKRKMMRPHAFRNFNGCLLYHRGWTGTRHDVAYVRDCLGHSNDAQSLEYIMKSTAVTNDRDWRKVMCGDARTYWHIFHHYQE